MVPVSIRYFGIGTYFIVPEEPLNASSQHEITYTVVNDQKVAIYVGRKHFFYPSILISISVVRPSKTMFCILKYGERFSIKG